MNNSPKLLDKYILRSKDTPLIEFSLFETKEEALGTFDFSYSLQINKIHVKNKQLFPKNLPDDPTEEQLLKWINKRKAPKNRQFVEKILAAIDDSPNPLKYVNVSHALSLNDAYWISSEGSSISWKDCNLYEHPFDKVLSYVAFTGYSQKISGLISSPELTSSGALKKCWSNRPDGIYLIKGDEFMPRPDGRSQATIEYYAAQVAEALDFEHINYDLEEFHHRSGKKEIVCVCKLFTSENEGFVEAATYFKQAGIDVNNADLSSLSVQQKMLTAMGPHYADMMVFDSLIANADRHLGNFGMMVDNNTGKYLRTAPLFDNGYSLFYGAASQELTNEHYNDYVKTLSCKYFPIDKQARLFVEKRHLPKLRPLLKFEFRKHPKYNIDDDVLKIMSKFIQERARKTINLFHEKVQDQVIRKQQKNKDNDY
ncbi:hypothetical protein [Phascolarctobacterium faecium]|uniref:hypothetical protein n=1 Tax=Phascolarctobacterium faecium TaxID=33025 RepID=UPI003076F7FB